jgi:hypothetical protein
MEDSLSANTLIINRNESINDYNINHLLENAKSAIFGAIELHNKPIFPCRYEIAIVLTINAWELAMKAYIHKYLPEHKMFDEEGKSKPFEKCVSLIHHHLGNDFLLIKESIERLYQYRCNIIHYYGTDIEGALYLLLRPNIISFSDFFKKFFEIDLAEEANLIILPIGFKRIISPLDFLSDKSANGNEYVRGFIADIKKSAQTLADNGFEDGLLCNYGMYIEKEYKISNADIVVGVTQDKEKAAYSVGFNKKFTISSDPQAQSLRLDEESIYRDYFNMTHADFTARAKKEIDGFREGKKFMTILKNIRLNEGCYRKRCLDVIPRRQSIYKPFYSELALQILKEEYEKPT